MRISIRSIYRRLLVASALLAASGGLLPACLASGDDAGATPTRAASTPTALGVPSVTASPAFRTATPTQRAVRTMTETPPPVPDAVQAAVDAAAEEFSVQPARIEIVSYRQIDWPSTALGCPEPGRFYAQIVTPGYDVQLDVAGERVTYHTNMSGSTVVRC